MKTRTNRHAESLDEIISFLKESEHPAQVWVSKNYSITDLIQDLSSISCKGTVTVEDIHVRAVALLFQKQTSEGTLNKIRNCFIEYDENDDDYDIKAKGERYFRNHPDFKDELEGCYVAAWNSVQGTHTIT